MYPYILCYCGRSIGDIYLLFKQMRVEKYQAAYSRLGIDIDPNQLPISDSIEVNLEDVFEKLNIHAECCRVRLITQVEFKDMY